MMVSDTSVRTNEKPAYESEHQDSLESQGSFEYSQDSLGSQKSGYFSENSSSGVESDDYVSVSQVQAETLQQKSNNKIVNNVDSGLSKSNSIVRKPASVVISGIRLDHRSYRESLQIPAPTPKVGLLYQTRDLSPTSSFSLNTPETIVEDDESYTSDVVDGAGSSSASHSASATSDADLTELLKPDNGLADQCRSYFEQRRKKAEEWTEKWSSHDATPVSSSTPASSLSEKLRCLRLEMRDLMERDESLLEKLLGLHEAIETLKSRRLKDPYLSLPRKRRSDDESRPVMTPVLDDQYPDSDDAYSDPPVWPNFDNEDNVSICSSSVMQSSGDQDPDDPAKEDFHEYFSRGFVRQHVSYPPIARNRVSTSTSHEKLRQSITAPADSGGDDGEARQGGISPPPSRGRSMTHPFPASESVPDADCRHQRHDRQQQQHRCGHRNKSQKPSLCPIAADDAQSSAGRASTEQKRHEVFV